MPKIKPARRVVMCSCWMDYVRRTFRRRILLLRMWSWIFSSAIFSSGLEEFGKFG